MHRREVTHTNGSYERKSHGRKLADEMGRAKKFPWYTDRLMHWKRVACELHDSYFRLMTIKHAISKIEWALNYYITQSSSSPRVAASWVAGSWQFSSAVRFPVELEWERTRCGRESHIRPKGPFGPWWIGVQRRCWYNAVKKASTQQSWPQGSGWVSREQERHNVTVITVGVKILQFMFDHQHPHTQPLNNPFEPLQ